MQGRDRYPYPVGYQATRLQGGHEYRLEVAEGIEGPDFVVGLFKVAAPIRLRHSHVHKELGKLLFTRSFHFNLAQKRHEQNQAFFFLIWRRKTHLQDHALMDEQIARLLQRDYEKLTYLQMKHNVMVRVLLKRGQASLLQLLILGALVTCVMLIQTLSPA